MKQIIKEKNKIRKTWQTTRLEGHRLATRDLEKRIKQKIADHTNNKWAKTLENLKATDGSLWKIIKRFKRKHSSMPTLTENDKHSETDKEKAGTLATYYKKYTPPH